jgi:hypothetical protein
VSFATITLCVASQKVVPKVSLYFVIDSVQRFLDTPSYKLLGRAVAELCRDTAFICSCVYITEYFISFIV